MTPLLTKEGKNMINNMLSFSSSLRRSTLAGSARERWWTFDTASLSHFHDFSFKPLAGLKSRGMFLVPVMSGKDLINNVLPFSYSLKRSILPKCQMKGVACYCHSDVPVK
jgi:hypothetical protein